jgi:protein phosphatase
LATQHGRNRGHILLVADGMGGHRAGEVASALSVATIESFVLHVLKRFSNLQATDEPGVLKELQMALQQADARIFEEASHDPQLLGMGTTLTMAFISGRTLFVMHAGDSRCYLLRGGQLRQLTTDHTVAAELARQGVIRPEDVSHHHFRHVVTSFLGGDGSGGQVEVHRADLEVGDTLLLCSDGLSDMLPDEHIASVLRAEADPEPAARRLVAEMNERGGKDNVARIE